MIGGKQEWVQETSSEAVTSIQGEIQMARGLVVWTERREGTGRYFRGLEGQFLMRGGIRRKRGRKAPSYVA